MEEGGNLAEKHRGDGGIRGVVQAFRDVEAEYQEVMAKANMPSVSASIRFFGNLYGAPDSLPASCSIINNPCLDRRPDKE